MRTDLDTGLLNALLAEAAVLAVCARFDFGGQTYRYCDGNIPVYLSGDKYSPDGLRMDSIEAEGNISAMYCRLTLANASDAMSSVLLGADCREDPVTLYWAALTAHGAIANSGAAWGIFFRGMLDDFDINWAADEITLKCVNELAHWQSKTMRKAEVTCPWVPGGIECGLPGIICDQTWERCTILGNTINYGGALYISKISEQQLWWGKGVQ